MPRITLFESCRRSMANKAHSTTKRDPLFDVVKFFAILLVVVGHVFNKGYEAGTPVWFSNFRDEMTMPLFFIVSGYFASRTVVNGDWRKLIAHIRSYLQPLFVFSLVFTPCYYVFQIMIGGDAPSLVDALLYPVKRVLFAGWFVWVLSFSYVIAFVFYRPVATARCWVKVIVALVVICSLYFVPGLPKGACQVRYLPLMFPFFVLGIVGSEVSCLMASNERSRSFWKLLGLGCFVIYLTVISSGPAEAFGLSMYSGQTYGVAWATSLASLAKTALRIAVGLVGACGIIAVISYLKPYSLMCGLASLGKTTLGIYLMHQWLLDRVIELDFLPGGLACCIVVTAMLFVFCHFVVLYTNRYRILKIGLWGHSQV